MPKVDGKAAKGNVGEIKLQTLNSKLVKSSPTVSILPKRGAKKKATKKHSIHSSHQQMQVREDVGVYGEMEEILRASIRGKLSTNGGVEGLHQIDAQIVAGPGLSALFQVRVELCVENCLPHSPHPLFLAHRTKLELKESILCAQCFNHLQRTAVSSWQHPTPLRWNASNIDYRRRQWWRNAQKG